ncbi:hypothetical protein EGW08_014233 [Elysia chlorotica]|uniref:MD-2-related lipid-recognition domain-containing protein n=1 Tax=Elysia chlorotica TaxID=188477 RepID=A0A433T904_ELYCH|nr:hypothetical protein EGW08_014233 [Elysia chlorotica]
MSPYTFLAAMCLVVVTSTIEARLDLPDVKLGKMWKELRASNTMKTDGVEKMSVDEINNIVAPFLLRGQPMGMIKKTPKASLGAPFKWDSCGPADQLVEVRNLTLGPSPFTFPGTLKFGFDIVFHDTISADDKVAADLKLQINARGVWIDIPCIGNVGSCQYDDLCSILNRIQCPADLQEQGIPCSCPFNKGEYKLQKYSVTIDASVFLAGDYKAKAVLSESSKGQIACYEISFTVE